MSERAGAPGDGTPPIHPARAARWPAALLFLALAVAWGTWIRVDTALSDPNFDAEDPRGMLRSDPALLFYLTERILESGGGVPADFRADPRIQHPFLTDVPREFPVGQEFLVAWAQGLSGSARPLHVTALWVMGALASLFVAGTYLAVRALTGSGLWAGLAALLALLTPANYRTIGFVLVGEDIALPFFALHLGLLAVALRTERARDFLLAGGFAALALSTWHASSFVVTLELAVLFLGQLASGASPLAAPRRAWVLAFPLAAGLAVPVLRANGLLFSPAAALVLALAVPALAARRRALTVGRTRVLALVVLAIALPVLGALAPDSYAHVHQVVWGKLRWLGRFPADPSALSLDARLLWQGPFETLPLSDLLAWCGWPLALAFLAGAAGLLRGLRARSGAELLFPALALASIPLAWMFARLVVLPGMLAPVAAALAFAAWPRRGLALGLFGLLTLAQAGLFGQFVREHRLVWTLPPAARAELVELVEWIGANVPPDEPILCDFVDSTVLLAHTRRPIVLQPKYETDRSRRAIEAFLDAFFRGSADELAELMRARFRCRYLLVDRYALWELARTTAGLRADEREPRPGTAAARFLARDEAELAAIPGFELVYRGKADVAGADFRLFRLR